MKRVLIGLLLVGGLAFTLTMYWQWNKPHRDAASEEARFSYSDEELVTFFSTNPDSANALLLDQVVAVTGKIGAIEGDSLPLWILNGVVAEAAEPSIQIGEGDLVQIKGRVTHFDDLFGEVRLDQATLITKNKTQ